MVVDIDRALAASDEALELWRVQRSHPEVPLFSGGLMDSWPGWAVDALAIARQETSAVQLYLAATEVKEPHRA